LLQQYGYLVLRFLAEDVGRELKGVLDAILSALAHRQPVVSTVPLASVRRSHS
jgi:very-short-patch-repair endonuclease